MLSLAPQGPPSTTSRYKAAREYIELPQGCSWLTDWSGNVLRPIQYIIQYSAFDLPVDSTRSAILCLSSNAWPVHYDWPTALKMTETCSPSTNIQVYSLRDRAIEDNLKASSRMQDHLAHLDLSLCSPCSVNIWWWKDAWSAVTSTGPQQ